MRSCISAGVAFAAVQRHTLKYHLSGTVHRHKSRQLENSLVPVSISPALVTTAIPPGPLPDSRVHK